MEKKTKLYFKLCKKTFLSEEQIGWINDPDFIIPSKGDIININEEQIRIWNGEYTNKDLEVINPWILFWELPPHYWPPAVCT